MLNEWNEHTRGAAEDQDEDHQESSGLRGEKYIIRNDGEELGERIFGGDGALSRAISASLNEDEKTALMNARGLLQLECRKTLTLDEYGEDKTILHCYRPDVAHSRRQDFVAVQFEEGGAGGEVATTEYPARLEAIFSLQFLGAEKSYVLVRTMQQPTPPMPNAVMRFAKTKFDPDGRLWLVSARTITKRILALPNLDSSDGEFYIYPDTFPDVLG